MATWAIQTEKLGKRYFIGGIRSPYRTVRGALVEAVAAPVRRAARLLRGQATGAAELDRELWALRDVSLEIGRGEVVGIIGRNGAGKTTLLKLLSRITVPTEGRARIRGRVGSLLEVGTGFHPELTGRENVYLNGAILGMRRAELERKFDPIIAFAEVERFVDTPVKFYSSGMYVRLAFAVAAHLEPEILLVDEVLAVGDAAFQKKCLGKMGDVARGGRTVLFVSHNMVAVQGLCERAICLRDGGVVSDGPPAEVVSQYLRESAPGDRAETVWDDPETEPRAEGLRLHRVAARPESGAAGDAIDIDEAILLEFDYSNSRPGARVGINFHLLNETGIIVFEGGTGGMVEWNEGGWPRGRFSSVCRVPSSLLNAGVHYLTVQLVKDNRFARVVDHALAFEVRDLEPRVGAWHGKVAGAVRPPLEWETRRVSALVPGGRDG